MKTVEWHDMHLVFGEVSRADQIRIFREIADRQAAGIPSRDLLTLVDDLIAVHALKRVYDKSGEILDTRREIEGALLPYTNVGEFRDLPCSLSEQCIGAAIAENRFLLNLLFRSPAETTNDTAEKSD